MFLILFAYVILYEQQLDLRRFAPFDVSIHTKAAHDVVLVAWTFRAHFLKVFQNSVTFIRSNIPLSLPKICQCHWGCCYSSAQMETSVNLCWWSTSSLYWSKNCVRCTSLALVSVSFNSKDTLKTFTPLSHKLAVVNFKANILLKTFKPVKYTYLDVFNKFISTENLYILLKCCWFFK